MSGSWVVLCSCGASLTITWSEAPLPSDRRALVDWHEAHRACGSPLEREGYLPGLRIVDHGDGRWSVEGGTPEQNEMVMRAIDRERLEVQAGRVLDR